MATGELVGKSHHGLDWGRMNLRKGEASDWWRQMESVEVELGRRESSSPSLTGREGRESQYSTEWPRLWWYVPWWEHRARGWKEQKDKLLIL